ncbi:hypothetical protein D3C73_1379990 [compost metagenome]
MRGGFRARLNREVSIHLMRIPAELFAGNMHGFIDLAVPVLRNNTNMGSHNIRAQFFGQFHNAFRLVDFGPVLCRVLEAVASQITNQGRDFKPE